jgi:hypothetical protein
MLQRSIRGNRFVKNYEFDYSFGAPWGRCSVTMTSVIGHLTGLDFEPQRRPWTSCPPEQLFYATVVDSVAEVRELFLGHTSIPDLIWEIGQEMYRRKYQRTCKIRQGCVYLDRL